MNRAPAVVLVARGSTDPRAGPAVGALAQRVARARPHLRIRPAYLEHEVPALPAALAREAGLGYRRAVLVPLLLVDGYHARVRLADRLAEPARTGLALPVVRAPVLGPADPDTDRVVLDALVSTLAHLLWPGADAVVVAATGTRASRARHSVHWVAGALARLTGVACRVGYVTAAVPGVAQAVAAARADGAVRVAVAAYLLAPGRTHDAAVAQAMAAGAVAVAQPLTASPGYLADAVLGRLDAVTDLT